MQSWGCVHVTRNFPEGIDRNKTNTRDNIAAENNTELLLFDFTRLPRCAEITLQRPEFPLFNCVLGDLLQDQVVFAAVSWSAMTRLGRISPPHTLILCVPLTFYVQSKMRWGGAGPLKQWKSCPLRSTDDAAPPFKKKKKKKKKKAMSPV